MRKALLLGIVGSFMASSAMACSWGASKTAETEGPTQTVMTDQATPSKPVQSEKKDTKG